MAHPVVESIKRKFFDFEDFLFEKWHGIDVRGVITNENLVTPDLDRRNHATAYHAVWCRNLRALLTEAAKTGNSFENFVDVGSGKGKACLYAHFRKSFQKIIGVEFSTPLVEIANRNRDKTHASNVIFLNVDACDFLLPDGASLVFLFNPFDASVLDRFISNNLGHFRTNRSVIAYANDLHRVVLNRFGFETLFRDQTRRISLHDQIHGTYRDRIDGDQRI